MTRLLVSVRDAWEAGEAWAGGADIIDVKEPRFGSLGAASSATRIAVRHAVGGLVRDPSSGGRRAAVCLSAALGELREFSFDLDPRGLEGYRLAKIGLAGCASDPGWADAWLRWQEFLPQSTDSVAVVYADYRRVAAPSPWELLEVARATSTRTVLVDTSDKRAGGLLDSLSPCELDDLCFAARESGWRVALAGSITLDQLSDVLRFHPDWIAVRGAVCRSGRESRVDRTLVERFASQLSTPGCGNTDRGGDVTIDAAIPEA